MSNIISCTLALVLFVSGIVPLAGASSAPGTVPVYRLRGYIGPPASVGTPVCPVYLPVVMR